MNGDLAGVPPAVDSPRAARQRYFPAVEGMRGVAVLLVLGGHVLLLSHPQGGDAANFGHWTATCGLLIFFLISGFLLYRPFVAARGTGKTVASIVPNYALRRAVRIVPAYWVALTLLAIWPGLPGVFTNRWWVDYGLLQVYNSGWQTTGLGVAWTLCVEITFYMTLPFVAALLHNRGMGRGLDRERELGWELGVIGGLALLSLLTASVLGSTPGVAYLGLTLVANFHWFCLGMLLAAIQITPSTVLPRVRRTLSRPLTCWSLALFLFAAMTTGAIRDSLPLGAAIFVEGLALGLLVTCVLGPAIFAESSQLVNTLAANRGILFLGTVSYGIYLWHLPIVYHLNGAGIVANAHYQVLTLAVLALVFSVLLGTASWYLIEKPLMKRVRSIKGFSEIRKRTVDVPAEPTAAPPSTEGAGA